MLCHLRLLRSSSERVAVRIKNKYYAYNMLKRQIVNHEFKINSDFLGVIIKTEK